MHPTTHIPPATPVTPIAHTACALLALRTFGLYTDSPFPQHDYLLDPVSLGLAGLVVVGVGANPSPVTAVRKAMLLARLRGTSWRA